MTSPTAADQAARLITRRRGLALLATAVPLGLVAACSSDDAPETSTPAPAPTAGPTVAQQVSLDEAAIIALYDAVISTLPDGDTRARPVLVAIREQHQQHLAALDQADAPASEGAPAAPATIATLVDAERAAARGRIRSCTEAQEPELARVLAFIAASEASHVPALRELA